MRILALLYLLPTIISTAAPVCPAGTAVGYFRLEARRPDGGYAIPIDRVNRLQKGDTIVFYPSDPPVPTDVSGARVALMLLTPATGELRLLETRKATGRQEWVLPEDAAALGVAYGPRGLDEDKMRNAATKDPELIAQLADYSEKTAQTEIVLSALSGRRQNDDRAVDAALQGLASTGGASKLDRNASLDQQTLSLFRTINPAIGAYDPLAPEPQQRWQQSATLATSVAGLFFGNTVGLAGGGAALFLNMRSMMFPKTELRSALLREAPEPALCAAKPSASRTKFAYLWARQLPQGTPPKLRLTKTVNLAIGLPAVMAVEGTEAELTSAGRTFRWKLVDGSGKATVIPVTVPAKESALRVTLIPKTLKAGTYRLVAEWDWTTVEVAGEIRLHPVPDISTLRLTPDSADRLVTNTGPVRARLAGAPTYFVQALQLLRLGDALAKPMPLAFAASAEGDWLEFEVNTAGLAMGPYRLTIGQQGGAKAELAVAVQAPPPAIENLPVPVHEGETRTVTLAGRGLERIEKLMSRHARIDWNPATRQAAVTVAAKAPAEIDIEAQVEGRHQPLRIAAALRALGPKPVITGVTRAPQQAGVVERRENEVDVAQAAAFSLQVKNMAPGARVVLGCQEKGAAAPAAEAKPTGVDSLYFTIAAGTAPGCTLTASVGGSEAVTLGRTVALPLIAGFALTDEAAGDGFKGTLTGKGLEAIGRTGWTADGGRDVAALPMPEGEGQKLEIVMPWPAPAPHAPLRIWLRGETEARLTTARY